MSWVAQKSGHISSQKKESILFLVHFRLDLFLLLFMDLAIFCSPKVCKGPKVYLAQSSTHRRFFAPKGLLVIIILSKVCRLIHLYLFFWKIKFEKSSLTNWIFNLQKLISKLIFAGYTGSKTPVRNRLKIQFVELDFSNLIFQKSSTDG